MDDIRNSQPSYYFCRQEGCRLPKVLSKTNETPNTLCCAALEFRAGYVKLLIVCVKLNWPLLTFGLLSCCMTKSCQNKLQLHTIKYIIIYVIFVKYIDESVHIFRFSRASLKTQLCMVCLSKHLKVMKSEEVTPKVCKQREQTART